MDEVEDIDDSQFDESIPPVQGSIILHMVKQARIGMSLSRITFPSFVNETRSIVERFSDWCRVAPSLREMNDIEDPVLRMLKTCVWFTSGLHLGPRTPKVPFNSLLGEVARYLLVDSEGKVIGNYLAELTMHPPPVAAFQYKDTEGGIRIYGHIEMVSKFLGNSIVAYMDGDHSRITVKNVKYDEEYDLNSPNLYGRGILIGRLAVEVAGTTNVTCEKNNLYAKIFFDEKPMFWGRYNCVHGAVYDKATNNVLIKFEGRWSAYLKATDMRTGKSWICFDIRKVMPTSLIYPNQEDEGEYEACHIWRMSRMHLEKNELNAAMEVRLALNAKQDAEEKWYTAKNKEWNNQFFHYNEERKQWIPNDISEDFMTKPIEMPQKPETPLLVQEAMAEGISRSIDEVLEESENMIIENDIK